jgi:hypothetical protein
MQSPSPTSKLHRWPLLLAVVFAALLATTPLYTDDAGFHVATGRWIRTFGQVPDHNPFSYAQDGEHWVQHQWLPAVAMSWLADHFGALGLVWAKIALVASTFAAGAWALTRTSLPVLPGLSLLVVAAAVSAFRFLERPFLVSVLALAVVSGAVAAARQGTQRWLWLAAVVPAVAVQMHAGGLDGLLVWAALLAGTVLEMWLRPLPAVLPPRKVFLAFGVLVVLVVGGLFAFAPAGLQVLALPIRFSANSYWHEHLAEFRPLRWDAASALPWLGVAVMAASALRGVQQRLLVEAFVLLGFALLASRHVRMVWPMWAAGLPMVARVWQDWPGWQRRAVPLVTAGVALVVGGLGLQEQQQRFGLGLHDRTGIRAGLAEQRFALPMLQLAAQLPGEALVSDGLAGTWLWQIWQPQSPKQHRVLVHNCLECYKESTYVQVYQPLRYGEPGWQQTLQRYGIRTAALKFTTPGERRFQNGAPNLRQHLFASPQHVLVDFDDVAAVYTEAAGIPADVSVLTDWPVDPDSGQLRPGAEVATALTALATHAANHPHVSRSLWLQGKLLIQLGQLPQAAEVAQELLRRNPDGPETASLLAQLQRRMGTMP